VRKGQHQSEEAKSKIRIARLGKTLSEATRAKLRGNKHCLGHKLTDEHRMKISQALKGRVVSDEERAKHIGHFVSVVTRAKISAANRSRIVSAETKAKISLSKKGIPMNETARINMGRDRKGHIVTPETRAKISRAHKLKGTKMSPELLERLRLISKTRVCTPETRLKLSIAGKGRKDSPEVRKKKSLARIGMKFTPEHCANVGKSKKIAWQDPEWRDMVVKRQRVGKHIHPNHTETRVTDLLQHLYPDEWKFVGDGSFIIGGKNPDFVNVNGQKKVIEFFGDYWHAGNEQQIRTDIFAEYGFSTLVIWEHELKDIDAVKLRIVEFHNSHNSSLKVSEE
jgi:very-short-patch-repair endonuclease